MVNNIDDFARMVAEEVKNNLTPLHKKELLKKENWGRWKDCLLALSNNLQDQLDRIEEDEISDIARYERMGAKGKNLLKEAKSAYVSKKSKISRFKFHVDKRLDEVALMLETGEEISSDGWEQVEFYKRAITRHRQMLYEFDLEDTSIDRALWATLNNKWEFDNIDADSL
jgi:hypothetical protein